MSKKYFDQAFTLAEVLITLAIIGVVAALLIVPLMHNIKNAELASYDKKARSVIANGFLKAASDNGGSLEGFNLGANLGNYFKLAENCNITNSTNCWGNTKGTILQKDGSYRNLVSDPSSNNYGALTLDGMEMAFSSYTINCDHGSYDGSDGCYHYDFNKGYCGSFNIDINGAKPPNIWGQDIREVFFFKDGHVRFQGQNIDNYSASHLNADSTQYNNPGGSCYDPNNYHVDYYN